MLTLPIGILSIFLVTYFSLNAQDSSVYLNQHSLIIVGLGTLAVLFFSTPKKDISLVFMSIKDLFQKDRNEKHLKEVLIALSKGEKATTETSMPLVSYALMLWEKGVDKDNFEFMMQEKLDDLHRISEQPVLILKNLSKYPPALGMTGTVMGMISLFANLNSDNKDNIGQALAVAMTATFYGLILANMVLLPLADRIHVKQLSTANRNEIIFNALLKINNKEPSSLIESMNIEQEYYAHAG